MTYDPTPIEAATFGGGIDQACHSMATKIFQAYAREMFNLPSEPADVGRLAQLPTPTTLLPREKPIPKPRPPTKWELFAQKKGITKQKRSKVEFDEATGEWRRRYGYKKANDEAAVPIIEAGPHEETGVEDPFTKMRKEKKQRVKKNEAQQLANLKAAAKSGGKQVLPATLKLAASLPEHGRGKPTKRKELKGELKVAARQVATSTASLGKFDRVIEGEDVKELRKIPGVKRAKLSNVTGSKEERSLQDKLVNQIISKNADDVVDVNRAIGKFEAAARDDRKEYRMKMKGANKKGRLTGGGGSKGGGGGGKRGGKGGKK